MHMVADLHSLPTVIGSEWTVCQTQFSARHLQNQICYAVHWHTVATLHSLPTVIGLEFGVLVTCGVKMMLLCHS